MLIRRMSRLLHGGLVQGPDVDEEDAEVVVEGQDVDQKDAGYVGLVKCFRC